MGRRKDQVKKFTEAMSLTRFKYDESVFNEYTLEKLKELALKSCSDIYYFAAIGEDAIPVIFTADGHFIHRVMQRLGCQYASVIVGYLIERAETNHAFGNWLDDIACESIGKTTVAVYVEDEDFFFYLDVYDDSRIRIATIVSGCTTYFVDATGPICTVTRKGVRFGLESSTKLQAKHTRIK